MSVSIKYKGSEIAALTATGTKTLNTAGKYCEGDIVVENTESGGGGGGSTSETWVLDSAAYYADTGRTFNAVFTSNGLSFSSITPSQNFKKQISYDSTVVKSLDRWASEAYRKLTFAAPPTGELLTWLTANGVKQPANLAVQSSKDVTITSNGTTEITPDAPYDVMEKANLTVNVPTGGSVDMRTINITVDGQGVSDIEGWAVSCSCGTNDLILDSGTPSASISVPNQTIFVIYISPDMLVDVSGIDEAIMFDVLGVSGSYEHLTEFPDSFIYVCSLNATGGNSSFTLALSLRKNPNYL